MLAAEQRAAVTDEATGIIQDRGQRTDDLTDVATELALRVPELSRLKRADRMGAVFARDRRGDAARLRAGGPPDRAAARVV